VLYCKCILREVKQVVISDIRYKKHDVGQELCANISPSQGKHDFRVWFRFPSDIGELYLVGDPFVAGFLIPCMYLGEDLHIDALISARLLGSIETIQSIMACWFPSQLKKVAVTCAQTYNNRLKKDDNSNVACFFSGGVDSWYSVLKHKETISSLILIKGFDIRAENEQLWESAKETLEYVAQALGKRAVTVETNLREYADMHRCSWARKFEGIFWGKYLHGSSLAAVGLCLQNIFGRIIIPSTESYANLAPWGSHPLLDPLWATENTTFIHDGCEANRMDKTKTISKSELALSRLRVCYDNVPGRYNCCICEKCCRTMLSLKLCGALEKATSFDLPLNLNLLKKRRLPKTVMQQYRYIWDEAKKMEKPEITDTIEIALGEKFSFYRTICITWEPTKRLLRRVPFLRKLVRLIRSIVRCLRVSSAIR